MANIKLKWINGKPISVSDSRIMLFFNSSLFLYITILIVYAVQELVAYLEMNIDFDNTKLEEKLELKCDLQDQISIEINTDEKLSIEAELCNV